MLDKMRRRNKDSGRSLRHCRHQVVIPFLCGSKTSQLPLSIPLSAANNGIKLSVSHHAELAPNETGSAEGEQWFFQRLAAAESTADHR